jgi:hypothetical protein
MRATLTMLLGISCSKSTRNAVEYQAPRFIYCAITRLLLRSLLGSLAGLPGNYCARRLADSFADSRKKIRSRDAEVPLGRVVAIPRAKHPLQYPCRETIFDLILASISNCSGALPRLMALLSFDDA